MFKSMISYKLLAAYTQCCPANVNMKHYKRHPNFDLVVPAISFWQSKQLPMDVANAEQHVLPHTHVYNNAHPVTWSPYAKFQPDWSINKCAAGIMTSYGCGNDQTIPIDTHHAINNAYLFACTFQILVS